MASLNVSSLLLLHASPVLLVFINLVTAAALDVPNNLPQNLKDLGALGDEDTKSKIIDQINGQAGTLANAPKSDATGALANMLKSAPAPQGKDQITKIMDQLKGPAPQADALKTGGEDTMLSQMFKSAPGPGGSAVAGAAVDVFTSILKRGPPATDGSQQKPEAPPTVSGSPTQVASGVLLGVVAIFSSFVAL
ncbi:unnamed protein product [Prunus armeniaca]|uniref:Uncharacterized protein n=1 Tax=Prunus armeniaca TaxID=36596 RepID=A0A6J5WBV5_PRUAR|nr:hypothetical protein GBA52_001203 [Prunus armeniaca]CAB4266604.1 unnamed protein product [Prunus armeniaca]CAB4297162.1 unnamed protein product [Prunus armeniaca]